MILVFLILPRIHE